MNLKILLPYKIFADIHDVSHVVIETSEGCYGLLPHRLDCVAALVPGILTYEIGQEDDVHYVAIDEGVAIKAGAQITVSARNAIGGTDLGRLGELVQSNFADLREKQREAITVIAKLEKNFVYGFDRFLNR